jgi:hypothetical protein
LRGSNVDPPAADFGDHVMWKDNAAERLIEPYEFEDDGFAAAVIEGLSAARKSLPRAFLD